MKVTTRTGSQGRISTRATGARSRGHALRLVQSRGQGVTTHMANMVFDPRYKQEMEGLEEPPFDSDFGQKIFKSVSQKSWGEWVERQKMLLNEYRLQPWTREAQEFLVEQMNEFFFGEGGALPKEFVAPTT